MNSKNKRFLKYLKQLRLENGSDTPIPNQTESRPSTNLTGSATMTETINPTFGIEQITPDFAEYVLETKNSKNRSMKPANLRRLVTAIDNGE